MTNLDVVKLVKKKALKTVTKYSLTDEDVLGYVEEVVQCVKNYCAIPEVPGALAYTVANMVVDLLLYDCIKNSEAEIELDTSKLDTLNIGDTTLKFANDAMKNSERQTTLASHNPKQLDAVVMNYKQTLNMFRRLY